MPVADIRAEHEATDITSSARVIDLDTNGAPPRLGERVVACNVDQLAAPFGHRGTITATHAHSGSVDVVFDTPFVGGTSLQGSCDNFRGLLCPWTALLSVRDPKPGGEICDSLYCVINASNTQVHDQTQGQSPCQGA